MWLRKRAFRAGESEYEIHLRVRTRNATYRERAAVRQHRRAERECGRAALPASGAAAATRAAFVLDRCRRRVRRLRLRHHTHVLERPRRVRRADREMHALQLELCAQVRANVDYASIHLGCASTRSPNVAAQAQIIRHRCGGRGRRADYRVSSFRTESAICSDCKSTMWPALRSASTGTQKARPPGHPYLRLTRTLEPGFVVTIEPGLYFIDALAERGSQLETFAEHRLAAGRRTQSRTAASASKTMSCVPTDAPENLDSGSICVIDCRVECARCIDFHGLSFEADRESLRAALPDGSAAAAPKVRLLPCASVRLIALTARKIANATMTKSNVVCRNAP